MARGGFVHDEFVFDGASLSMTLKGVGSAVKQMERIERGVKSMAAHNVYVFSRLPYGYGMEYGHHRRGGLARKRGGHFYLRRAVDEVLSNADRDLAEGLDRVTAPGVWVLKRLGGWAARIARKNAPRGPKKKSKLNGKTYRLNRSISYRVYRRKL